MGQLLIDPHPCPLPEYRARGLANRVILILLVFFGSWCFANPAEYFGIQVIDDQSGRGVPLVELTTTNNIRCWTDSNGYVAFNEPGLMNRPVWFSVKSQGYEFRKDGFGFAGVALTTAAGKIETIKIHRGNIAERMYRMTGQGIYRDTVLLGKPAPIEQPVMNARVMGQDSVVTAIYRGKIYWFWGDTAKDDYPMGHFGTAGATSEIREDPNVGINLHYFVDENGFSKPMFKLNLPGAVWMGGAVVAKDESGKEKLIVHYSRVQGLEKRLEHGLAVFNDEKQGFDRLVKLPDSETRTPDGQVLLYDGYYYFCNPFPLRRCKANFKSVINPNAYEKLPAQHQLRDVGSGKMIDMHAGSICWNEYRKKFVMIGVQVKGETSMLGEVWYAESAAPTGPWGDAIKIVTHDRYSFYNPVQHAFLDQKGGRFIYFEGTYASTFSRSEDLTPRYEYNQMMYRLDLSDARLKKVQHP